MGPLSVYITLTGPNISVYRPKGTIKERTGARLQINTFSGMTSASVLKRAGLQMRGATEQGLTAL